MLEISVIIISVLSLICLKILLNINFKTMKQFDKRGSEELKSLAEKFPKDEEICKNILHKLNNENVKINIVPEYNSCLYTIFNNTIIIGKFKQDYMKIQTIAHECLHSIQNKRNLWCNFIFTNLYLLYFAAITILTFLNKLPYTEIHMLVLIFLSIIQYVLRNYLEDDASMKARTLAKEYIEENKILTKEEEQTLLKEYDEVNKIAIPFMSYYIISMNIVKIMLYAFIALV